MANINPLKQSYQTLGDFVTPTFSTVVSPTGNPNKVPVYSGGYSIGTGDYPSFRFVVTLADLNALGAFLTGDIILATLPAGATVLRTFQKHEIAPTDAVGGTGANVLLSAATTQLVTVNVNSASGASANHSYGTNFSVFSAPSATSFDFDGLHPAVENFTTPSWLIARLSTTGANFNALTNGKIYYFVDYQIYNE